jgi:hypothetical protein
MPPTGRFQNQPDFSGFFHIELSVSAPLAQGCLRSERVSDVLGKCMFETVGSFILAAQDRRVLPDTTIHIFLQMAYTIQWHTIEAIAEWLFILTARIWGP